MRVAAIIPARLDSTRFPRKLLEDLDGLPVVAHVARNVSMCKDVERTVVATGDEEIVEVLEPLGIEVFRTTRELPSGTDRIAEANAALGAEIVVNVQGDEPLIEPRHVEALLAALDRDPAAAASTLRYPLPAGREAEPNSVKVVVDARGRALYFSRLPLAQAPGVYFRHLGLYAYRKTTLETFRTLAPAPQELAERLEQLRLLNAGLPMAVGDAPSETLAVDVPGDLAAVREAVRSRFDKPPSRWIV
jgi:3-deoxy-manno-octulosonate cytidylyltransferase (CMP-KDO synthetase)